MTTDSREVAAAAPYEVPDEYRVHILIACRVNRKAHIGCTYKGHTKRT